MKRTTRVRWTAEERSAVVRRAQSLLAQDPKSTLVSLFGRSQDVLPKERQRPSNPAARSWLQAEIKKAGPLPSAAEVWKAEPTAVEPPATAAPGAAAVTADAAATSTAASAATPARSPLAAALVELGVEVVTGILADPRVRASIARWMQSAPAPVAAANETANETAPDEAADEVRDLVVVAGCSPDEARSLEKELKGTLPLTFWGTDEPRERLLALLPRAELVIGVADALPAPVDSSLSRLGARYVRHKGGVQALYRRLAEHALR